MTLRLLLKARALDIARDDCKEARGLENEDLMLRYSAQMSAPMM